MSNEPENPEPAEAELSADATPVCPHCLAEISPVDDYCSHCGEAVGQLTGIIPFVNIRFQTNFYGKLWRKVWYDKDVAIPTQAICLFFILFCAPIMFVGLPFVLWDAARARRRRRNAGADLKETQSRHSQGEDS